MPEVGDPLAPDPTPPTPPEPVQTDDPVERPGPSLSDRMSKMEADHAREVAELRAALAAKVDAKKTARDDADELAGKIEALEKQLSDSKFEAAATAAGARDAEVVALLLKGGQTLDDLKRDKGYLFKSGGTASPDVNGGESGAGPVRDGDEIEAFLKETYAKK